MAYVGYGWMETTATEAGAQAWLIQQQTIRPGTYRMLVRCEKQTPEAATTWRFEPVQGRRDLSGVVAPLGNPVVFDAAITDSAPQRLSTYVDLGVVTLPPRAGTLSVAGAVPVPLGVRITRLTKGTDQIRVDAIVLLPVNATRIRDTRSAVIELAQTTSSGDAPPSEATQTALVLDGDQGLGWIASPLGVEPGIPGVRGGFPRLRPGYDNVIYLLHQTGARIKAAPEDFLSDDPSESATVQVTYIPSYTFTVTTTSDSEGTEEDQ